MGSISTVILLLALVGNAKVSRLTNNHSYKEELDFSPPKFTKSWMKHSDVKVVTGSHTFRCPAVGYPEPAVVWLKDGIVIECNKTCHPNKWSLHLPSLKLSDTGKYTCIVNNVVGHVHFDFHLTVMENVPYPPLVHEISPGNKSVRVGETVKFLCRFMSEDLPFVQWIKYDGIVSNTNCGECGPHKVLPNRNTVLDIKNVTLADSGQYQCVVSNSYGEMNRSVWLKVLPPSETASSLLGEISHPSVQLIMIIFLMVVATLLFCVALYCIRRRFCKSKKSASSHLMDKAITRTHFSIHDYAVVGDPKWEIPKNKYIDIFVF